MHNADSAAAKVIAMLGQEFTWPCPADVLAHLVYGGLTILMRRSLVHLDPELAKGTTALRHALDVISHAPADSLDDIQEAVRIGFDAWLDGPGDDGDEAAQFDGTAS